MRLTAKNSGYFIVTVDGVDVSKHTTEREAVESAVSRVLPGNDVRYRHDYVVVVQEGSAPSSPVSVSLSGLSVWVNEG